MDTYEDGTPVITDDVVRGTLYHLDQAKAKLIERGKEYNNGFTVDDYMLKLPQHDEMFGYLQMIHLKAQRAISCRIGGSTESFVDSLVDLINYAGFAASRAEMEVSDLNQQDYPWIEKEGA